MKIGYIRVSTEEQNTARQEVLLRELGVDEVFIDKASGKKRRPAGAYPHDELRPPRRYGNRRVDQPLCEKHARPA